MKALILDGSREEDRLTSVAVLGLTAAFERRGARAERLILRDLDIAPCAGCFGCWTRTPGECVFEDDARDVLRSYLKAGVVAYVTPVTFGGYSSHLKKALDRFIPMLDPRFAIVGGEVHHRLRYARYPITIGLGTLPSPDLEAERSFARLTARNGLNFHRKVESIVLVGVSDPLSARESADRLLDRAGVTA